MRQKILSLPQLEQCAASIRERDARLVLTNGCFDLLHVGHVRYLAAARALGDALAVAVNSDSSVRRLKGEGRPLMPQDERAEILAALESVDFVVVFDEDSAQEVVAHIRPAVYVKGGDYSGSPLDANFPPEGHVVNSYGGEVAIVPYEHGHSTTGLLARSGSPHRDAG